MSSEPEDRPVNLYEILGLEPGASDDKIREAYYALAKAHHPDQQIQDEKADEAFKAIVEAAAILRDPQKRRLYDSGLLYRIALVPSAGAETPRRKVDFRRLALVFFAALAVTSALAAGLIFFTFQNKGTPQKVATASNPASVSALEPAGAKTSTDGRERAQIALPASRENLTASSAAVAAATPVPPIGTQAPPPMLAPESASPSTPPTRLAETPPSASRASSDLGEPQTQTPSGSGDVAANTSNSWKAIVVDHSGDMETSGDESQTRSAETAPAGAAADPAQGAMATPGLPNETPSREAATIAGPSFSSKSKFPPVKATFIRESPAKYNNCSFEVAARRFLIKVAAALNEK